MMDWQACFVSRGPYSCFSSLFDDTSSTGSYGHCAPHSQGPGLPAPCLPDLVIDAKANGRQSLCRNPIRDNRLRVATRAPFLLLACIASSVVRVFVGMNLCDFE